MKMRIIIIIILAIFIGGCGTSSKVKTVNTVAENYKDVFILSNLICEYLRNTNEQDINLNELVKNDTLRRISDNFEKIEIEPRGGYIAVYYKFSDSRDVKKIELSHKERETINKLKWIVKNSIEQYDGEIQFDYGERFYRIRKIILK